MQKYALALSTLLLLFSTPGVALDQNGPPPSHVEVIENKKVAKIDVSVETLERGQTFDPQTIRSKMRTKTGEPFSQRVFDHDLKTLSDEYERVDPYVQVKDGQIYIKLLIWEKPFIHKIKWSGNTKIKTKTLQSELGVKPDTQYNKEKFIKAFNKLKEYYVKKGYFEAQLSYRIIYLPQSNQIEIDITVNEGRSAHITRIEFEGMNETEESAILSMINTKRYNLFTSWLTGRGYYREEAMEHDKLTIVNYLQNEGYADARVKIELKESKEKNIIIVISADKGPIFHFGQITISGNDIKKDEEVIEALGIKSGEVYGPDKLREAVQAIKTLYGHNGYIDTNVDYDLKLSQSSPSYDVHFSIEESQQYKVGIVRVLGNVSTQSNVILNRANISPGDIFDSEKLTQTEQNLMASGFFKSVNVYAVRSADDAPLGSEYRDVNIEVQETSTGSASIFFGASSTESVSVGIDLTENNFNAKGLTRFWTQGISSLRGGGQFAHLKVSLGKKYQTYAVTWLDPYFKDTLWRLGFDISYSRSRITNKSFLSKAAAFNFSATYPLSAYWNYGWKYRLQNTVIQVGKNQSLQAQRQTLNSGIVTGVGLFFSYDSTDNIIRPHRGFRSSIEGDIAVVRRHDSNMRDFLFSKLMYLNSYYYPVWKRGTLKVRGDLRFLATYGYGTPELLPANERFYLGGENSVRGYRIGVIGPKYQRENDSDTNDPMGGASSALFSVEYLQSIFKIVDAFAFFDAGSVSINEFTVDQFRMSTGVGLRLDIGNRLPLVIGYGWPINPMDEDETQRFFFSMGGQF
jgi:outer membrane protein insertion porin family